MTESWWEYVQRASSAAPNRDIAARSRLDASAISRWKKRGEQPTAHSVVAFARGYNRPAIEAMIAAGYLTDADLVIMGAVPLVRSIKDVPDSEFVAELQRRLDVRIDVASESPSDGLQREGYFVASRSPFPGEPVSDDDDEDEEPKSSAGQSGKG